MGHISHKEGTHGVTTVLQESPLLGSRLRITGNQNKMYLRAPTLCAGGVGWGGGGGGGGGGAGGGASH